jgi:hypothetical protein
VVLADVIEYKFFIDAVISPSILSSVGARMFGTMVLQNNRTANMY